MTILTEGLPQGQLLLLGEVAAVFRVHPGTVRRWVRSGRLKSVPTPGGRLHRFNPTHIAELLAAEEEAVAS